MFSFKVRDFFDIDEKGPEGQPVKVQFWTLTNSKLQIPNSR
jgi:hypothetical protein